VGARLRCSRNWSRAECGSLRTIRAIGVKYVPATVGPVRLPACQVNFGRAERGVAMVAERMATDDSTRQMKRIRSRARIAGLTIRTRRVSRASSERAYSVIDRATGQELSSDIPDLDELTNQLWWIIRQRRRDAQQGGRTAEAPRESCPACETLRVGNFRFCRSCGFDFEPASVRPAAALPVASRSIEFLQEGFPDTPRVSMVDRLAGTTSAPPEVLQERLPVTPHASTTDQFSGTPTWRREVIGDRFRVTPRASTMGHVSVPTSRAVREVLQEVPAIPRRSLIGQAVDLIRDVVSGRRLGPLNLIVGVVLIGLIVGAIVVVAMTRFAT
jgi:hypothetical protein